MCNCDNFCPCCGQRKNGIGVSLPYFNPYQRPTFGQAPSSQPITSAGVARGAQGIGGFGVTQNGGGAP